MICRMSLGYEVRNWWWASQPTLMPIKRGFFKKIRTPLMQNTDDAQAWSLFNGCRGTNHPTVAHSSCSKHPCNWQVMEPQNSHLSSTFCFVCHLKHHLSSNWINKLCRKALYLLSSFCAFTKTDLWRALNPLYRQRHRNFVLHNKQNSSHLLIVYSPSKVMLISTFKGAHTDQTIKRRSIQLI